MGGMFIVTANSSCTAPERQRELYNQKNAKTCYLSIMTSKMKTKKTRYSRDPSCAGLPIIAFFPNPRNLCKTPENIPMIFQ